MGASQTLKKAWKNQMSPKISNFNGLMHAKNEKWQPGTITRAMANSQRLLTTAALVAGGSLALCALLSPRSPLLTALQRLERLSPRSLTRPLALGPWLSRLSRLTVTRITRRLRLLTASMYLLVPAHECSQDERAAAADLVEKEVIK